ncbi:MAG: MFS transporter [Polyangiales bacterium]
MTSIQSSAAAEWRRYPMVPIAAALGYSTSVIHIYGLGPYLEPVQQAFGWSRSQATVGLTIATFINAIFCIPIGALVDRWGPRTVGLIGVLVTSAAFALVGTATGGHANWYALWAVLAAATLPVQATIWTSAVASRFEASRGLALAITLCGASIGATVFPLLATWLIGAYGWRTAFFVEGAIWAVITFPMLLFFFRGARDSQGKRGPVVQAPVVELSGVGVAEGLRSFAFARLFIASALFTFTIIALVVHFVPILKDRGAEPMAAAGVASLVGLFSIAGRLATGILLDRYRASFVGAGVFLLPIIACLLLLFAGSSWLAQATAAAVIGLTLGSEVDVIVYLTTRHFGLKNFGTLYGGLLTALSLGTAFGPLAAAAIYDRNGSYELFLRLTILFMAGSSLALASLPHPTFAGHSTPAGSPAEA